MIVVCLIVFSVPVYYVANDRRLHRKYERALTQIKVGDTEESVISLMGQPDEKYACYPSTREFAKEYWYDTFLEPYIIYFDQNGRVSGKQTMVSP